MNTIQLNQKQPEAYRFKILKGENQNGRIEKTHQAGLATMSEGNRNYVLHIYMLQHNQFFLVPHKSNPERYYIMVRQPMRNPNKRAKFSWNIVGYGQVNSGSSCIELHFDLFNVPLYMNIFPEENRFTQPQIQKVA